MLIRTKPLLIALRGPDVSLAVPINQRAGRLALLYQNCIAAETWNAGFAGTRLEVNLPRIHPFEIIATVADANASLENCHLSSGTMIDRNPNLPGRAFFTKTAVSILRSPLKSPSR